MNSGFEVFQRSLVPHYSPVRIKTPTVTIGVNGMMHFSGPAFELLGKPEYVVLLYTEDRRLIGFRKAKQRDVNAYRMQSPAAHPTVHKVGAKMFFRALGIETSATQRYALEVEDGVARIDLEQPQAGDFDST